MKILVTGANGYLGQGIVKQLLDDGVDVVATDITGDSIDRRADIICCNLFEIEEPFQFIHNSVNHIVDLPKHMEFLKKLADQGIKRIAAMGSMHEVGFHEGSIDETTPCRPQSLYGIGKDSMRNITTLIAKEHNIDYLWLRGYYIVGHSEYGNSIFSKITAAVKEGKTEFPFTMGQNQYDFIDYDEFCIQVAAAMEQQEVNGIVNICSGTPEKLADRVERFIKEHDYSIRLQYGAFPDRPYDSKAVWGNNKIIMKIMSNYKLSD